MPELAELVAAQTVILHDLERLVARARSKQLAIEAALAALTEKVDK